jgi:hypothetical protein
LAGQRVSVTYCGIAKTSVCFLLEEDSPGLRAGGMYGGMLAVCEREAPDAPSDAAATDASESSGASEAAPPGEVRDDAAAGFAEGVAERRLAAWAQIAPVSAPGAVEAPAPRLGPPLATTSLARWRRLHPNTKILKPVDSHAGHYEAADRKLRGESPHANPSHNQTVTRVDPRLDPEAEVFGVAIGGESAAWTLDELKRAGTVEATLSGRRVVARWDAALNDPVVETVDATLGGGDGAGVQDESETFALRSLWYAWGNFHPETKLSERALAEAGAVSRDAPREASE